MTEQEEEKVKVVQPGVVTGEQAYLALRKGMGRQKINLLEGLLKKGTPQEVYTVCKFGQQDLHADVKKMILLALHYMKDQLDKKQARQKRGKNPKRKR